VVEAEFWQREFHWETGEVNVTTLKTTREHGEYRPGYSRLGQSGICTTQTYVCASAQHCKASSWCAAACIASIHQETEVSHHEENGSEVTEWIPEEEKRICTITNYQAGIRYKRKRPCCDLLAHKRGSAVMHSICIAVEHRGGSQVQVSITVFIMIVQGRHGV
jgi:hypothetical protein